MIGRRRVTRSAATVVALAITLTGCGASVSGSPAPTTTSQPTSTSATTTTPPLGGAPSGALAVSPLAGRPRGTERFTILLRAPVVAGHGQRAVGELSVTRSPRSAGSAASAACVSERTVAVALPARAGSRGATSVVSLGPAQLRASWCRGRFTARVEELVRPVCRRGQMCPQFIRLVGTLGPVSFKIS